MRWPWQRETRGSNYSTVVMDALLALAEGKAASSPFAVAAVESCAGLWGRSFAQADVSPRGLLSPSTLYDVGRTLALSGEFVALFEVGSSGPVFTRPASYDVRGGHDPESWSYSLWLQGPTQTTRLQVPRDRVVHVRINQEASTPWRGRSPIQSATTTGRLLAGLEAALADEGSVPVGRIVATPEGSHKTGALQKSINALRGKLAFVETTAGGFGDRAAAPNQDFKPQRVGPDYTPAQIELRKLVESSVCGLYGVHPGLISGSGDGTAMRESYRRYQRSTLEALAAIASVEFGRIIDAPVKFDFSRLRASDSAGQARAFRFLVGKDSSIDQERALALAGLSSSDLDPV